ncbi:MAG: radical SAM protein, partial [Polyangiaceae bacterium]|nr:radical SAM protein [Polyangiaceae bacterium]
MSQRAQRYREGDALHAMARTPQDWSAWAAALGERSFRGTQVFRWLHARGEQDAAAMTDLPRSLQARLAAESLGPVVQVQSEHRAADGTTKVVLRLCDGLAIETVLIPAVARSSSEGPCIDADVAACDSEEHDEQELEATASSAVRVTQCISTQVGCAMGCGFCASGATGLRRHLGPEEIVAQALLGRQRLQPGERLSNVVLMGMGEPLHNYDATARAVRLLSHADGVDLSTRRITVSTVGLVPGIEQLG